MFIPDPDFYPCRIPDPESRIQDPTTATKEQKEKFDVVYSHKYHKNIENYFIFELVRKINLANLQRIKHYLPQKAVTKLSDIWIWDQESAIDDPEETYSGFWIQKSKRRRIPDPNPNNALTLQLIFTKERLTKKIEKVSFVSLRTLKTNELLPYVWSEHSRGWTSLPSPGLPYPALIQEAKMRIYCHYLLQG